MKQPMIAAAAALALGASFSSTAIAGTVGLSGTGTGSYALTVYEPGGSPVSPSLLGNYDWTFDFDNGTASLDPTDPYFSQQFIPHDVTFSDNGDGTYDGDMLVDWGINTVPVSILWDINEFSVTTLDGDGDGIPGNAVLDGLFTGFSLAFDGDLTGQTVETVVPIPAAAWMFGSGLVGIVGLGWRRKR